MVDEHGGDIYAHEGVRLDFSVSTNPRGLPEPVRAALLAQVDACARYPDPQCRALRAAIARHEGVPPERVLCGNGASELIQRLCRVAKPRKALVCAPSFSEYERALRQCGCEVARHVLRREEGFALGARLEEALRPGLDMLFLCQPNNPVGNLAETALLEGILRRAAGNRTRVVVDECFLGFTLAGSAAAWLDEMPELVVLKALTKTHALAGLRLGYLLASDAALLAALAAAAPYWNVSTPAQIAGIAALSCPEWLDESRRLLARERAFLRGALQALGIEVFPGEASFLLLCCETPLFEPLLRRGILIRSCANFAGLDASFYRIGVKTRPENAVLSRAIGEVLDG
ncbi:MAG: aminotransferase class I/II-fold pyridoxal phosphate-dependent enzyme [Azoarcus sp.]|nr:aminotransferase class I/II-fold pyridoxal phosphate-dependent enzyme [Azoarcus sp.]